MRTELMVEQGSQITSPVTFPIQTLLQEYAAMSQQEAQETVDKMKVTSLAMHTFQDIDTLVR